MATTRKSGTRTGKTRAGKSKAKQGIKEEIEKKLAEENFVRVKPMLRRDPDAPVFYAPAVEVRTTPSAFHMLLFVPQAADPDEVEVNEDTGEAILKITSTAEVIFPPETVLPLIKTLAEQYRSYIEQRLQEDAGEAGIDVGELYIEGIDDLLRSLSNKEE